MRVISFKEIENLKISIDDCLTWAKNVILNKKKYILPPKTSIHFGNNSFFNTMPSLLSDLNRFGVKEVSRIPEREPALQADILLYDTETGRLLSFMDGSWITTMRTGAVAAITVDTLKNKDCKSFTFIGLGNTARATLLCLQSLYKNEELEINILAYKNQHDDFINRFSEFSNLKFNVFTDVKELIRISQVIISCVTVANDVFAEPEDYKPGVLVVPVHTKGFQNCDLCFDKIYCDDISHISGFKYFNQYKYVAELSDVLTGKDKGRENSSERILAYNIGISVQDIYFASKIYDMIAEQDLSFNTKFWV